MKSKIIALLILFFIAGCRHIAKYDCQNNNEKIKDTEVMTMPEVPNSSTEKEKALILNVQNVQIVPATAETGAPELVADIIFKNQSNNHLLVNFYHKPWIKAMEPKSLFRIEKAIPPPHMMRMPDASDLIRIPPKKSYIYKFERWFEDVFVGKPYNEGYIYSVLKPGEYTISFCFTSSPDDNLEKYRKENEVWWQGEVSSSPVKFIFKK